MDIRSVLPSQLIAESGSDIVVINFGSASLRVGVATKQAPVVVPHCIAHHLLVPVVEVVRDELRKKGTITEQGVLRGSISAARRAERDEICQKVELQLKMKPFIADDDGSTKVDREGWTHVQLAMEESMQWTQVMVEDTDLKPNAPGMKPIVITNNVVQTYPTELSEAVIHQELKPEVEKFVLDVQMEQENLLVMKVEEGGSLDEIVEDSEEDIMKECQEDIAEDSEEETNKNLAEGFVEDSEEEIPKEPEKAIEDVIDKATLGTSTHQSFTESQSELQDISNMEIHVEVPLEPDDSLLFNGQYGVENPVEKSYKYRPYLCGEEALNIAAIEPYCLKRPICRGHLNISQHYSLQQVCDDIYSIWDWVLTDRLGMGSKTREQFSAVLVVPDTLDNREIKELLSIILRDLHFRSAVVHQESIAATFANGISSACVVNMGAQITSVVCVEDGVVLPATRIVLPFGGEDISRCLLWVQQRRQTWPPIETDTFSDPLDLCILERIKENYCLIIEGDQRAVLEIPYHESGRPSLVYKGSLPALNVPVMGLFYPSLLTPEEYPAPSRPGFHIDHEDGLDETSHVELSRKPDTTDIVLPSSANGGPLVGGTSEILADDTVGIPEPGLEESGLGLSRAIVNSILSIAGRPDLQKKLFASIQLVGGTAYIRGLIDAVEERVLHDIPADEAVDTVAVLQNRTEAPIACWKGGAILGILDFSRDAWVHRDDWVTGGVRLGCLRKYKDSYTLHSQAFYYSAALE